MREVFNKLFLAILLLFPISVFAAGSISVSPSSLSIEVGSSKTFTISAYNTIGDVSISSSNSSVASVSTGEWETGAIDEGQTKTGTITVTGESVGTSTITLTIDAATFDGDDLSGQTKTISVSVVEKTSESNDPENPENPETPDEPAQTNNSEDNGMIDDTDDSKKSDATGKIAETDNEDQSKKTVDSPNTGVKTYPFLAIFIVLIGMIIVCLSLKKIKKYLNR